MTTLESGLNLKEYKPTRVFPPPNNNDRWIVNISGEEYELCDTCSYKRWSNTKTGTFGVGRANSTEDPRKVERTGLLGEIAFGKIIGLPVDLSYQNFGDKYDFKIGNKTVNLKTSTKLYHDWTGLIRAISDKGFEIPLTQDIYAFAAILNENREMKVAQVVFIGYIEKDNIDKTIHNAKNGVHKNYEIKTNQVKPMQDLYKQSIYDFL